MQYRQEISVVFKDGDEKECEEYAVPNGNTDKNIAAQALVSMDPNEKIGITLTIEPKFKFHGAEGLRVTIATGNGTPSPDDHQGFWISRSKQDQTTTWTHFLTWASERAKRHQRRLKAPAPQGKIYASAARRYSANIFLRWRFRARICQKPVESRNRTSRLHCRICHTRHTAWGDGAWSQTLPYRSPRVGEVCE